MNLLQAPFSKVSTIHFIGVGGIGMSGLAAMFAKFGFKVQGSDIASNNSTKHLNKMGIHTFWGHDPKNIEDADIVVVSSAIKADNEEYKRAIELGLPIFKRAKMLAELMRFKWSIAVAGTHGKTTTTSLVSHILHFNNLDPTAIIGGIVNSWGQNSRFGESNWIIAESDESDGSFLDLPATISIITNIEEEHMDYYKNYENLRDHFVRFVHNIPFYGFSVVCIDNQGVQDILPHIRQRRLITYGVSPQADYRVINIVYNNKGVHFDIECAYKDKERTIENIYLPMYGHHNVLNAVASIIVADNIGIEMESIKNSLLAFQGIKRRFTNIGEKAGVKFIDDYAHHPSEIEAVINGAKHITDNQGKIISIVQPHRYSRLRDQFNNLCKCFNNSDHVIILDVYKAGEDKIEGFDSETLVQGIKNYGHKHVEYLKNFDDLNKTIVELHKKSPLDMVIFMGAGDITNIAQVVFNKINFDEPALEPKIEDKQVEIKYENMKSH
ncbi:UDP-N-acetylmuramate--L-alanine ligase [Candidatus Hepatincolaceae symbiont of Richtersius coronifer]